VTSVADGAAELLFVAVSPRTAGVSGRYFTNQQPQTPSKAARNPESARRLWQESAALLGIEEPLAPGNEGTATDSDRTAASDD
jgi:hypothetical protein